MVVKSIQQMEQDDDDNNLDGSGMVSDEALAVSLTINGYNTY